MVRPRVFVMRSRVAMAASCLLTLAACGKNAGAPGATHTGGAPVQTTPAATSPVLTTSGPLPTIPTPGTHGGGRRQASSTRPWISPSVGAPRTSFRIMLMARQSVGARGAVRSEYRLLGTGPSGMRCDQASVSTITRAKIRQHLRVTLRPSSNGWCRGRWQGRVVLVRAPACHSSSSGTRPPRCPEFASQVAVAGRLTWRVR